MCSNKINLSWKVAAGCTVAYPMQYWQWESTLQLCDFTFVLIKSSLWCCSAPEHLPLEFLSPLFCLLLSTVPWRMNPRNLSHRFMWTFHCCPEASKAWFGLFNVRLCEVLTYTQVMNYCGQAQGQKNNLNYPFKHIKDSPHRLKSAVAETFQNKHLPESSLAISSLEWVFDFFEICWY